MTDKQRVALRQVAAAWIMAIVILGTSVAMFLLWTESAGYVTFSIWCLAAISLMQYKRALSETDHDG